METAAIRIIFILICLGLGFKNLSGTKLADRTPVDLFAIMMASGIGTMAVAQPETPLQIYLVPLITLILVYRLGLILYGSSFAAGNALPPAVTEGERMLLSSAARLPGTGLSDNLSAPPPMALPLIENGKIRTDNLNKLDRTQLWLRRELRHFGYRDMRQIRYLTIDKSGNFFMDLKKD
jgi:Predicted membrane protein